MAARAAVIGVHVEVLDHDHGHWCLACKLSTGIRAFVVIRRSDGPMSLQTRMQCLECGGHDIVADPDPTRC
jgi:hypothetical protein